MAGTNEFAFFFTVEAYVLGARGGGGVPESDRKKSENAFWPLPVRKSTFPEVAEAET